MSKKPSKREKKRVAAKASANYEFKQNDQIGANDARDDRNVLLENFIDAGYVSVLSDHSDHRTIVVGRTGAGKTALLEKLKQDKGSVIVIEPESLSFNYITNSTIISYLEDLGINLEPFYKLLWRHVFAVEVIKRLYGLSDEKNKQGLIEKILSLDSRKKKAINYLESYGGKFWEDTDVRIKEIVDVFGEKIENEFGVKLPQLAGSLKEEKSLSSKQKTEVTHRAQSIVSQIQVKELQGIFELLNLVLDNRQKKYHIVIDRLDEGWVDDDKRYKLIMGLLQTMSDFTSVPAVKPVIALRIDLLKSVFDRTLKSGHQEEKYESLYLKIDWTESQLRDLISKRLETLIRKSESISGIKLGAFFPKTYRSSDPFSYLYRLTFRRPRDMIKIFNILIETALGKSYFNNQILRTAEAEFSRQLLRSIRSEWAPEYPNLERLTKILHRGPENFSVGDLDQSLIDEVSLEFEYEKSHREDEISRLFVLHLSGEVDPSQLRIRIAYILYLAGIIGLKPYTWDRYDWVIKDIVLDTHQICLETKCRIHAGLVHSLGCDDKDSTNKSTYQSS